MQEKIEVGYTPMGPGGAYNHKYIVYTDKSGVKYGARGGPSNGPGSSGAVSGQSGSIGSGGGQFGDITTSSDYYYPRTADLPGFIDYDYEGDDSVESIKSGDDLSAEWQKIKDAMRDIGNEGHEYRPLDQNSNTTVDEALRRAGLSEPSKDGLGDNWSPGSGNDLPGGSDGGGSSGGGTGGGGGAGGAGSSGSGGSSGGGASGGTGSGGAGAGAGGTTPPRRDPLVLDLDGDGIETTSTRDGTVIVFDHDADGVKTGTGWVKSDDGWLVLDRNGNGMIDSGRELFGVDTLKSNGQFALDGFDALKDKDANNDSKIDAADAIFSQLRIWRDLNQDGVSQANEMATLGALGITSIGVNATAVRTDLGNGNVQTAAGTFTRTNGTTGSTGEVNGAAANLDLLVNTFYRQFTDHIPLTSQAQALPTLRGSGRVRDLDESISLSPDLGAWVQSYTQQTTRQGQVGMLDGFIEKWASTSDLKSLKAQADALSGSGVKLTYSLAGLTANTPAYNDFIRKLGVVERFMGFTYGGANGQARFTALAPSSGQINVSLAAEQIGSISLAYDRFKTDIYESLLLETRLKPYYDKIEVYFEQGKPVYSFAKLEGSFLSAIQGNAQQGLTDLIEFMSAFGHVKLEKLGWQGTAFLANQLGGDVTLTAFSQELSSWNVRIASAIETNLSGTSQADLVLGTSSNDTIKGFDGHDLLLGGKGSDQLNGGNGNDVLYGGAGNDVLYGGSSDYWNAGSGMGNDTYRFGRGDGADTIYDNDPTVGNLDKVVFKTGVAVGDVLVSRNGDALVLKINGTSDQIRVEGYFGGDATNGYQIEEIRFTDSPTTVWKVADIKAKVIVGTAADDVIIGYATADTINGSGGNDNITARDGNDVLNGGLGNDRLQGEGHNDTLNGNENDDDLRGGAGDDVLNGGAGNDVLYGGNSDYWNAGSGVGNDTYQFGRGDGADTIYDNDPTAGNLDKIIFKTGVAVADVLASRNGDALVLSIKGTADQIRVEGYFGSDATNGYQIEEIRFTDSPTTVWKVAGIKASVLTGSALDDTIIGYATADTISGSGGNDNITARDGNDVLNGGLGNDRLQGEGHNDTLNGNENDDDLRGGSGDDVLNGGAGNDVLYGGNSDYWNAGSGVGNDTYQFGRGDGADTIYDNDPAAGNLDKIVFKTGVAVADVLASRNGDALVLKINGTSDQIRVEGYFGGDATNGYQIEEIRFTDSPTTVWKVADIKAKVIVGTAADDVIIGYATADTINGSGGNDNITARDGNDVLHGGLGNDRLQGEGHNDTLNGNENDDDLRGGAGDDVLNGGTGNDVLYGGNSDYWNAGSGVGNDTYQFGRGDGADTIYDNDPTAGNIDKIVFKTGVAVADVLASRNGDALVLGIKGTGDQIRVEGYFGGDAANGYQIEEVRFTDSPTTVWKVADIKASVIVGTAADDVIIGYATGDTINGSGGNDNITARDGNDVLNGGLGNDRLQGEGHNDTLNGNENDDDLRGGTGDDVLNGGTGNDVLYGGNSDYWNAGSGVGNDTYQFGRGDGADTIYDNDPTAGNLDKIVFKTGVAVADVLASRNGDALVLGIKGTGDQIRVEGYFGSDATNGYQIEEIRFTDSPTTVRKVADIKASVLTGGASDDVITGNATADTISGEAGNDNISGRDGNDVLHGGLGNDRLQGEGHNDTLNGNENDDDLRGGAGDDVLNGGAGNDVLYGGNSDYWNAGSGVGNDIYQFGWGDGADTLYDNDPTAGNLDKIVFKTGVAVADVLASRNGDALVLSIKGTADQIRVEGYFGTDATNGYQIEEIRFTDSPTTVWKVADIKASVLTGSALDDTIIGYATADTISGSGGNDNITARDGNDVLNGGLGNDRLQGEGHNDTLNGNENDDDLRGGAGDDVLNGGAGNDVLYGGNSDYWNAGSGVGNDTYQFGRGDGADTIYDNDPTAGNIDKIVFKTGVAVGDVLASRNGDALILGIKGTADQIRVEGYFGGDATNGYQIEEIRFTDSPTTVWKVADIKASVLTGSALDDTIIGYATADTISGSGGNDNITARDGNDVLNGGLGNDRLQGEGHNDTLNGNENDDDLRGGVGDDVLNGGTGNDVLYGGNSDYWNAGSGVGNDTYQFGRGDGADTIYDNDPTAGNIDKIVFKTGVAVADVLASRNGDALILGIKGTGDQIRIESYFGSDATNGYQIEEIRFTDSPTTVWKVADIKANVIVGTAADDVIIGYATADTINGSSGNDNITARDGNDVLHGGLGNDRLQGEGHNDTLNGNGNENDDDLRGGVGDDVLNGGIGNDVLYGGNSDYWNAGSGVGNDTYQFGRGDGADTIYDNDPTAGNLDKIVFKTGVAVADVLASRNGDALVLGIKGTGDQIRVEGYFGGDATNGYQIEEIRFTDAPTTVWKVADIKANVLIGGAGDDVIIGYSTADTINGSGGNDNITARDGNDVLNGGLGSDRLQGEGHNDTLNGNDNDDDLRGGAGDDVLNGGTGNDVLYGGNSDYWNAGSGVGNDTYQFGRGDGADTIYDNDPTAGNLDKIVFKTGVAVADVLGSRNGDSLVLGIKGTGDQIRVEGYFGGDATNGYQIEEIRFTDSPTTVWKVADIKASVLTGSALDDTIIGYATADTINGNAGNDNITARDGNDVLNGGLGNDRLQGEGHNDTLNGNESDDDLRGGAGDDLLNGGIGNDVLYGGNSDYWNAGSGVGNDTYQFGRGDGADTVYDNDPTVGNLDTLSFSSGIASNQLWFTQSGSNLEVSIIGTTDKVTIGNWYTSNAYHVERFKASDGKVLIDSQVNALVSAMAGLPTPAIGQTTLPVSHQTALNPTLAASWG